MLLNWSLASSPSVLDLGVVDPAAVRKEASDGAGQETVKRQGRQPRRGSGLEGEAQRGTTKDEQLLRGRAGNLEEAGQATSKRIRHRKGDSTNEAGQATSKRQGRQPRRGSGLEGEAQRGTSKRIRLRRRGPPDLNETLRGPHGQPLTNVRIGEPHAQSDSPPGSPSGPPETKPTSPKPCTPFPPKDLAPYDPKATCNLLGRPNA